MTRKPSKLSYNKKLSTFLIWSTMFLSLIESESNLHVHSVTLWLLKLNNNQKVVTVPQSRLKAISSILPL